MFRVEALEIALDTLLAAEVCVVGWLTFLQIRIFPLDAIRVPLGAVGSAEQSAGHGLLPGRKQESLPWLSIGSSTDK